MSDQDVKIFDLKLYKDYSLENLLTTDCHVHPG